MESSAINQLDKAVFGLSHRFGKRHTYDTRVFLARIWVIVASIIYIIEFLAVLEIVLVGRVVGFLPFDELWFVIILATSLYIIASRFTLGYQALEELSVSRSERLRWERNAWLYIAGCFLVGFGIIVVHHDIFSLF